MKHAHSHMLHRGRANCTCSRPGPIVSSLCSLSAIVLLVPVLSLSLSLPLSLPPDLNYPIPFLAQPVSFYPLLTGCMQFSSSSSSLPVFSRYSTRKRSLMHTAPIGKVWLLSALPVRPLLQLPGFPLPIGLSLPSRWLCSIFPLCLHNRWNKAKKKHLHCCTCCKCTLHTKKQVL